MRRLPDLVVALAVAAVATICLACRYLPMVDLPQHYAMVSIIIHARDPYYGFADRYTFDFIGRPYATVYLLAAALAQLMSLGAAMRIVVALSAIAPLIGAYALLRALDRPREWTLLAVPFAFGSLWHWGFLNFLAGSGLCMVCLAMVIALARRPSVAASIRLALVALLLLFTHFHGLMMLLLLAPAFVWACSPPATPPLVLGRRLLPLAPAALAAAVFVMATWSQAEGNWAQMNPGLTERVLRFPEFLGTGIPAPWPLATLATGALIAAGASVMRGEAPRDAASRRERIAIALAWLTQVALYFVLPLNTNTATFVSARHALLCVLFALPLLPASTGRRRVAAASAAALFATVGLVVAAAHTVAFDREARSVEPVLAAMQPNRRVLPMIYDRSGRVTDPRTFPYLHFAAYYQAARGGDLSHSFATVWNVPIRYRSDRPRYVLPEEYEWAPNHIGAEDVQHFDYVLVRSSVAPRFPPAWALEMIARSGSWFLFANPSAVTP